jgi:endonuclease G
MFGAPVVGDSPLVDNRNVDGWKLDGDAFDASNTLVVSRQQFVVAFNTKEKVPRWTAWQVLPEDIGSVERSNSFQPDSILNGFIEAKGKGLGVTPADYTNTCFDRGHQSPAKDRSSSKEDSDATFYMSNMAPQTPFLNRGIWVKFENHTRTLVKDNKKRLQVMAGPILQAGREKIGRDKDIAVPTKFFKIVFVYPTAEAKKPEGYLAVVMPNVNSDGKDPLVDKQGNCAEVSGARVGAHAKDDWKSYSVSLREIQKETGIKFTDYDGLAQL